MSKSAIYAVNTASTALADGATVPISTIIRRFGCGLGVVNNSIVLKSQGYYDIDASVTVTASGAGNITATLLMDGVPIPGAIAVGTAAAAADEITLTIPAIARIVGCNCNAASVLTLEVSGQATTLVNAAINAVKL